MWNRWVETRRGEPTNKEEKPTREWNSIKTLRRQLAWEECEMDCLKKGREMTKRRGQRQRALDMRLGKRRRRWGGRRMERGELKEIKENLRALLQIRLSKDRKGKNSEAETKARADFRAQGPRSLRAQREGRIDGDGDDAGVQEISRFLGGNLGGEGPL